MRHINLFKKVCDVSTTDCFDYNNYLVFAVDKSQVSRAIGKNGCNIKKLSIILRRRIKVIPLPGGLSDMREFISALTDEIPINTLELKDQTVMIGANKQTKAMLIGRNRAREQELGEILSRLFGIKKVRIG